MHNLLSIFGMGTTELVVVILIIILLFGGKKIPELMRGIGRGVREFNDAKSNIKKEYEEGLNEKKEIEKERERKKESEEDKELEKDK